MASLPFSRFLAVVLTLLIASNSASAGTYYVDPLTGDDRYDGLSATYTSENHGPFKNLQRIFDASLIPHAQPGDTILLRGGSGRVHRPPKIQGLTATPYVNSATASAIDNAVQNDNPGDYRGVAVITVAGNAENPITVKAYPGEKPRLRGSHRILNWHSDPTTQEPLPLTQQELETLGFPANKAIVAAGKIYRADKWQCDAVGNLDTVTNWGATSWDSRFSNPQQVFVWDDPNTSENSSHTYALRRVNPKLTPSSIDDWITDDLTPPVISNATFDVVGQGQLQDMEESTFFYKEDRGTDTSSIYVWLRDGNSPVNRVLEGSTSSRLFFQATASDAAYMHFEGLTFEYTNSASLGDGLGMFTGHHNVFQNCSILWFDHYGMNLRDDSVFENGEVSYCARSGLDGQKRIIIRNCSFVRNYNTIRGEFTPPATNPNASNNPVWDDVTGAHSGAIKIIPQTGNTVSALIEGCLFHQNRTSIWFDGCLNGEPWGTPTLPPLVARNNLIQHDNGIAIHVEVNDNALVSNNIILRCNANPAILIVCSKGTVFANNLIAETYYDASLAGVGGGQFTMQMVWFPRLNDPPSRDNVIRNNLFYDNKTFHVLHADRNGFSSGATPNPAVSGNSIDHNVYYAKPNNPYGVGFLFDTGNYFPPLMTNGFENHYLTLAQWATPVNSAAPTPPNNYLLGGSGYDFNSVEGEPGFETVDAFLATFASPSNVPGIDFEQLGSFVANRAPSVVLQHSLNEANTKVAELTSEVDTLNDLIGSENNPVPGSLRGRIQTLETQLQLPKAVAYMSSDQQLSSIGPTVLDAVDLTFGSETLDTNNAFSNLTSTFTAPVEGFYEVRFRGLLYGGSNTSHFRIHLVKNSSEDAGRLWGQHLDAGSQYAVNGTATVFLEVDDTLKVQGWQIDGTTAWTVFGSSGASNVSVLEIRLLP